VIINLKLPNALSREKPHKKKKKLEKNRCTSSATRKKTDFLEVSLSDESVTTG